MTAPERRLRANESDGLSTALTIFRRRWMVVVGVVIAIVAVAVVRHQHAAKTYSATASVAFRNATLPDAALQVTTGGSGDPVRDAATEALIARSQQVASMVRKQLNASSAPSDFL